MEPKRYWYYGAEKAISSFFLDQLVIGRFRVNWLYNLNGFTSSLKNDDVLLVIHPDGKTISIVTINGNWHSDLCLTVDDYGYALPVSLVKTYQTVPGDMFSKFLAKLNDFSGLKNIDCYSIAIEELINCHERMSIDLANQSVNQIDVNSEIHFVFKKQFPPAFKTVGGKEKRPGVNLSLKSFLMEEFQKCCTKVCLIFNIA